MIKVSVIVPFHNVEQYISKCLDSLVSQTLRDIEIICINDASDDNSVSIVENYMKNDCRITLLHTEKESGQSYARNKGLEIAKGEYIGFVDSDDWVETDMFEKMYNLAFPNYTDITMCMAQLYDDKEQKISTDDYYSLKSLSAMGNNVFSANDTKNEILNINVVLWNKIYKRTFLQSTGAKFSDGYIYEDLPFFFETYIKAQKINILWEYKYYYRQNRVHSTMQNSDKKVYDRIPMVEKTYEILKNTDFYKEKKAEILSWIIDDIFHRYTLLEDKYYEEYYYKMQEFFRKIELTDEDKDLLSESYCYDEFQNIVENSYYGFWRFLIDKYKTSNKRIKAAEHKCNMDIKAIKDYLESYKEEVSEEKQQINIWWENRLKEELDNLSDALKKELNAKDEEIKEKNEQIIIQYESHKKEMKEQEYALKSWQEEILRQTKEKITADYEWKLQDQRNRYEDALQKQKYYYENNFLLVKILLKLYKKFGQLGNKIKKIVKKN